LRDVRRCRALSPVLARSYRSPPRAPWPGRLRPPRSIALDGFVTATLHRVPDALVARAASSWALRSHMRPARGLVRAASACASALAWHPGRARLCGRRRASAALVSGAARTPVLPFPDGVRHDDERGHRIGPTTPSVHSG